MQTLVRFLLCCQKSEKDTVEQKHGAHHVKASSGDLSICSKQGSQLEEAAEEELPAQVMVSKQELETPATLQESALPLEEQKSQEDGGEDSVKVRKHKKRKRARSLSPAEFQTQAKCPKASTSRSLPTPSLADPF